LYFTASGIITPIGGRPVHRLREDSLNLCTGRPPTECDDTRCCIIQFYLLMGDDEHNNARNMWRNIINLLQNKNLCIKEVCHPRYVCENWKEYVVKHNYVN